MDVLVFDFGSQYTQLIARRIRELGVHSILVPGDAEVEEVTRRDVGGVVLSGGPRSVTDPCPLKLAEGMLNLCRKKKVPVLGICYGLQLVTTTLGGSVEKGKEGGEYGRTEIRVDTSSALFKGEADNQVVWMSHGDVVSQLPSGFRIIGRSPDDVIVAIEHETDRIYGLQYHPEVSHSDRGKQTIERFIVDVCGLRSSWTMESVLDVQEKKIKAIVPENEHVVCALSGGVDSTVAAVLVHRALGDRLHCVFVDNGLLRYKVTFGLFMQLLNRLKWSRVLGTSQIEELSPRFGDLSIKLFH